jgi:hypothetical protein
METIRQMPPTQRELYPCAVVPAPHMAPLEFIAQASWAGVLRYCVQRCGSDDYEIADKLAISHGYMAKVLKGTAQLAGQRLTRFMEITQCVAPVQWQAYHVGADLVMRDPAAARIHALEAEIAKLREGRVAA